jgi:hypothetical protein
VVSISLRRPWPCPRRRVADVPGPVGWRGHGPGPRAAEPARSPDSADLQAQALCDLMTDPASGITRVLVVGAPPRLLDAVAEAAADRGLAATETGSPAGAGPDAPGPRRVALERLSTPAP